MSESQVKEQVRSGRSLTIVAVVLLALSMICFFVTSLWGVSGAKLGATQIILLDFLGRGLGLAGVLYFALGVIRWATAPIIAGLDSLPAAQEQMVAQIKIMNERLLISDAAKRIAYRDKDREALRQAIREDMDRGDYDAAMVLVSEMARTYGYRLEAEQFREEIESARATDMNQKMTLAVSRLEQILATGNWELASAEAAKIQRLFPDSPQAKDLELRVREARDEHKKDLEHQFMEAARREDNQLASDLLKELDKYLTPDEAKPFVETARLVLAKKRDNLRLQFNMAMDEKDIPRAVGVAQTIIDEFPNSKMAEELRGMLPELRRKRGGKPTEAEEVG